MNKLFLTAVVLTLIVFIGCEGDMGPEGPRGAAGPSTILVWADINVAGASSYPFSFGPANRVDSVKVVYNAAGDYDLSCWGQFPDDTGVLIITCSSDDVVTANTTGVGTIDSWADSLIQFSVFTWNTDTQVLDAEDFSFVIFGE